MIERLLGGKFGTVREAMMLLALAGVVTTAAVFRVWTRTECVRLGYVVAELRARADRLTVEQAKLSAEITTLKSPIRITQIATQQLGLVPPAPSQIVMMSSEWQPVANQVAQK